MGFGDLNIKYNLTNCEKEIQKLWDELKSVRQVAYANCQGCEGCTPDPYVISVNNKTGIVTLNTTDIPEGTNKYYTDARARNAISLTTLGTGLATYDPVTGILNIPADTTGAGTVTSIGTDIDGIALLINGSNNPADITSSGTFSFEWQGTSTQLVTGEGGLVSANTSNIFEGSRLYFTNARARSAISLTTVGSSGPSTYNNVTGVLNIPIYSLSSLGGVPTSRIITINGVSHNLSTDPTWNVGTVTSITETIDGDALLINGGASDSISVSGSFDFEWQGDDSQYVNGEGNLATFPTLISTWINDVGYITSAAHVHGIANAAGTQQFTFAIGEAVQFAGTNGITASFDSANKRVTLDGLNVVAIKSLGIAGSYQTGSQQTLATGTAGTDFNITSASNTHTFNLPTASTTARGAVSTVEQTWAGFKNFQDGLTVAGSSTSQGAYFYAKAGKHPLTGVSLAGTTGVDVTSYWGGGGGFQVNANYSFAQVLVNSYTVSGNSAGSNPIFANFAIKPLTMNSGGTYVQNAATFYIQGAATGAGVPTNNYALFVDAGITRLDGDVYLPNITSATGDFVTIDSNKILRYRSAAQVQTDINALYTANNGLTMTSNNTKLGGTLLHNTNVALAGYTFKFTGGIDVGSFNEELISLHTRHIITPAKVASVEIWGTEPSILITATTASDSNSIEVHASTTKFASYGAGTRTGTLSYLTGFDANGYVIEVTPTTFASPITADNGLTKTLDNIQLGGPLLHDTQLTAVFNLSIDDGTLSVGASNTVANARVYTIKDTSQTGAAFSAVKNTTPSGVDFGATSSSQRGIAASSFSSNVTQTSIYGQLELQNSAGFAFTGTGGYTPLSGIVGTFTIGANTGTFTSGVSVFSGVYGYMNVGGNGTIDKMAAIRASYPVRNPNISNFTGTIANYYGLYIDDQSLSSFYSLITNKYGVYQAGAGELNVFNGDLQLGQQAGTGTRVLVVDAAGNVSNQTISAITVGDNYTDYVYDITGTIDGVNTQYGLTFNYQAGSLKVYVNGLRLTPGAAYDYEELGTNQFSLTYALTTEDNIVIDYIKA